MELGRTELLIARSRGLGIREEDPLLPTFPLRVNSVPYSLSIDDDEETMTSNNNVQRAFLLGLIFCGIVSTWLLYVRSSDVRH